VRAVVLTIALLFIGFFALLTALDIRHYGLSPVDVIAIAILVLFTTGIVGAMRNPPPPPPH